MNQINIMDDSGHSKFRWDPKDPIQVKAARETFDAWRAKGHRVFGPRKAASSASGWRPSTRRPRR
jgi:hypothetical protein